jgi:hypothetical protein
VNAITSKCPQARRYSFGSRKRKNSSEVVTGVVFHTAAVGQGHRPLHRCLNFNSSSTDGPGFLLECRCFSDFASGAGISASGSPRLW